MDYQPPDNPTGQVVPSLWFSKYMLQKLLLANLYTWKGSLGIITLHQLVLNFVFYLFFGETCRLFPVSVFCGPCAFCFLSGLLLAHRAQPPSYNTRAEALWKSLSAANLLFLGTSAMSCFALTGLVISNFTPTIEFRFLRLVSLALALAGMNWFFALFYEENVIQFTNRQRKPAIVRIREGALMIVFRGMIKGTLFFSVFYLCVITANYTFLGSIPPLSWLFDPTLSWLEPLWLAEWHASVITMTMWEIARCSFNNSVCKLSFKLKIVDGQMTQNAPDLIGSLERPENLLQQYLAFSQLSDIAWEPYYDEERAQLFSPSVLPMQYDSSALVKALRHCIAIITDQTRRLNESVGQGDLAALPPLPERAIQDERATLTFTTFVKLLIDRYVWHLTDWRASVSQFLVRDTHTLYPRQSGSFEYFGRPQASPSTFTTSTGETAVANVHENSAARPDYAAGSSDYDACGLGQERLNVWVYLRRYLWQKRQTMNNRLKNFSMAKYFFGEQPSFKLATALADWEVVSWSAEALAGFMCREEEDVQHIISRFGLYEKAIEAMEACNGALGRLLESVFRQETIDHHGLDVQNAIGGAIGQLYSAKHRTAFSR